MSRSIYLLAVGIFALVTSEFAVSGLMPQMAAGLDVSVSQVGYLVTLFSLAMSVGGPILAILLYRWRQKSALMLLFALFLVGNVIAAWAPNYAVMAVARVVTGAASGAFMGVAVTVAGAMVAEQLRGRAVGIVMQGLMLGTAFGLPLATWMGGQWGWRATFIGIGVLTLIVAVATLMIVPASVGGRATESLLAGLTVFRNPRLWGVMATSTLIIGGAFAAFSYFTPILQELAGFDLAIIPLLLLGYGLVTVLGTEIVSRLASRYTLPVLVIGTGLSALALVAFAIWAQVPMVAVAAMLVVGLVGVTMNPAMTVRVQGVGGPGVLVNTAHLSMITLGVVIGSAAGGIGIDAFGLRAPLWLGAGMAALAVLVMIRPLLATRSRHS